MRRTILWAGSARIITVGVAVIVALMLWMAVTTTPATKASAQESSTTLSTLWVVARADGSVVRSSGLTGLLRTSPGKYEVRFRRDVSGCAYTATVGDPGNQLVYNPGLVQTAGGLHGITAGGVYSNAGVFVQTRNLAGVATDYPFHLMVSCADGADSERAVVDSSGRLVRGSAQSASRLGTGRYEVLFRRDMNSCTYTATVGDPGNQRVDNRGLVFTAAGFQSNTGVFVETRNLAGVATDYPFHLMVSCADGADSERAVVDSSGRLARGSAQSVSRLGTGRYEVLFRRDVSRCAYTATVGRPGPGWQTGSVVGLVFTAGGHQSKSGVYVETKNLGGGLADFPFHLAVNCSEPPPLDAERVSLLHLNLQGLNTDYGPWRDRHRNLASWMGSTQIIPDLLVLQEVPASRCHFLEGCNPKDYESLFHLITAIGNETGIRYRVALLSTGEATNEGLYDLYQGRAVLYNPDRLINTMMPTSASVQPYGSQLSRTVERRESYPCKDPPQYYLWRCSLVDRQSSTWGLHWAVQGAAFARFALAEPAQYSVRATVDVYDVHAPFIPNTGGTPDLEPIGNAVRRIEQVNPPAAGTRMFPPILAGDFNTTEYWMNKHTTEPGQPLEEFEIAAYANEPHWPPAEPPDEDVIGILVGDGRFPSRYRAKADSVKFLPEGRPGLCGAPAGRWSDHCGQYAELVPIAR